MAKTLKDFLEGYLKVKSADEQKFIDKHVTAKNPDRNGNGDDVFKGNTKTIDRRKDRKGYNPGEDEKVYEALKGNQHKIDANKNGKVDAHDFKLLRKKKKVAEEAEQIDELSNATLRRYRMKAKSIGDNEKGDINYRSKGRDLAARKTHGGKWGMPKAKIMAKEEAEQIDELSDRALVRYDAAAKQGKLEEVLDTRDAKMSYAQKNMDSHKDSFEKFIKSTDPKEKADAHKTAMKRVKGLNTFVKNKVSKEEVEQIDELSTKKLSDYRNKSLGNLEKREKKLKGDLGSGLRWTSSDSEERKMDNRKTGIERSSEKLKAKTGKYNPHPTVGQRIKKALRIEDVELTQEEIERLDAILDELDEATYSAKSARAGKDIGKPGKQFSKIANKAAAKYGSKASGERVAGAVLAKLRKEETLAELISDLSESHKRTMTHVFEKLNDDNKTKFLEACDTPDGVEQMLDFAINHRGE